MAETTRSRPGSTRSLVSLHRLFSSTLGLVISLLAMVLPAHLSAQIPDLRVLPLGDSITYGVGAPGGYRGPLFNQLEAAGYRVDLVGTQTGNPVAGLPELEHEGHSGWQIEQINAITPGVLTAIDDPDVVLLLIGTNDFSNNNDTINAINRLEDLVLLISDLQPFAKILVANLTERAGPLNAEIQEKFNPFVPGMVDRLFGEGKEVYFVDLYGAVPLSDMPDGLHPNLTGYTKMATAWAEQITNLFSPQGALESAPSVLQANAELANDRVIVNFSKPVADTAAALQNFQFSEGVTVASAALNPDTLRDVALTTAGLTSSTGYQLTISGVSDRNTPQNTMPSSSTVSVTPARGVFNNVPEANDYALIYSLNIPDQPNYAEDVSYDIDLRSFSPSFTYDRVAYYMELQPPNGSVEFAWASFEPLSGNTDEIGVPTAASGALFQQSIANMNVLASSPAVSSGATASGGNIEFWPSNYEPLNTQGIVNASDVAFDTGDNPTPGNYGSMQIHNHDAGEVIMAFNRWGGFGGTADLGIGNRPVTDTDWTFAQNASDYAVKRVQVLARSTATGSAPLLLGAIADPSLNRVTLRFSKPLDDATAEDAANYAISGGLDVLAAELEPLDKLSVRLTTRTQTAGVIYTVTASGIRDRTNAALLLAPGSQIDFPGGGYARLPLSAIVPGTEAATRVNNGDFEDLSSGNSFDPSAWDERYGNAFYTMDSAPNIMGLGWDTGLGAARVHVDGGPGNGYGQYISGLDANTDYVVSAYMAVPGDAQHTGNAVLDMNDISSEVEVRIDSSDPEAASGYFIYATFNTSATGTAFKLRIFQDEINTTQGWPYQPVGAIWDNVAVTRASQFIPPQGMNYPPAFATNPFSLASAIEDQAYIASLGPEVTDAEGDPLVFTLVAGPAWLTMVDSATGQVSGTPSQADVGDNVFTVAVSDGTNPAVTATLQILVSNVNDSPEFPDPLLAQPNAVEGQVYSGSLVGTATDEDGDTLSYVKTAGPGWLVVEAGGSLSGTPGTADVGDNIFTIRVEDGQGGSDEATLSITVDPGHQVVARFVEAEVAVRGVVDGGFTNTRERDGIYQAITEVSSGGKPSRRFSTLEHQWTLTTASSNATLVVDAYKTASADNDNFLFSYSTDGSNFTPAFVVSNTENTGISQRLVLGSVSGTLTVKVEDTDRSEGNNAHFDTVFIDYIAIESSGAPPANNAPSWLADPVATSDATEGQLYSDALAGWVADPEGDPLIFSKESGPAWLVVANDGALSGTPGATNLGLNSFEITVDDGNNAPVAGILAINVIEVGAVVSCYVADIAMSSGSYRGGKRSGIATISIVDADGTPVSGAAVSAAWSGATTGTVGGTTNASGQVVLESRRIKGGGTFVISVLDVVAANRPYDPQLNIETTDAISN